MSRTKFHRKPLILPVLALVKPFQVGIVFQVGISEFEGDAMVSWTVFVVVITTLVLFCRPWLVVLIRHHFFSSMPLKVI